VFPIHPAVRQLQLFFDSACDAISDVFSIAFDMAEVSVRQIQTLRKQLEHAASGQVRMLVDEIIKKFFEVFMPYLSAAHRHIKCFLGVSVACEVLSALSEGEVDSPSASLRKNVRKALFAEPAQFNPVAAFFVDCMQPK
jgi:hypothetical protein